MGERWKGRIEFLEGGRNDQKISSLGVGKEGEHEGKADLNLVGVTQGFQKKKKEEVSRMSIYSDDRMCLTFSFFDIPYTCDEK